jgi:hypothetical protein
MRLLDVAEFARRYPGGVTLGRTGGTVRFEFSARDCAQMSARANVGNWIALANQFGVPAVVTRDGKKTTIQPGALLAPTLRIIYPELFS